MATKSHGIFELSDFQTYLEYLEFYVNNIVLRILGREPSDENLSNKAEKRQGNISVMVNKARHMKQCSDVIVKVKTDLIVSDCS